MSQNTAGKLSLLLLLALFAAAGAAILGPIHAVADEEDRRVEQYLARLGLVELQIVQLEDSLLRTREPSLAQTKARRLADLYAGQLMTTANQPQRYQQLLGRIERLVERYPIANTTALQVMLLQADYNRGEALVGQWIDDRSEQDAWQQALEILRRIVPLLDKHQQTLEATLKSSTEERDALDNRLAARDADATPLEKDRLETLDQELLRLQALAGRARYFAAWSSYYLGLVRQDDGGEAHFQRARELFRELLEIEQAAKGNDADAQSYDQLRPDWLGLETIWRARAMIGLGLTEAALGHLKASRACFDLLDDATVATQIRDEAEYWYVRGLLNAGKWEAAQDFAAQRVARYAGDPTEGKVSLCAALVKAACLGDLDPGLAATGLAGLARLNQDRAIDQLIERYDISLEDSDRFLLRWIAGKRLFAEAQQDKKPDSYQRAVDVLRSALALDDANREVAATGKCHYTLGWCYYQLKKFELAAVQFRQSIAGLKGISREDAAKAAWMAFASYHKLGGEQPRFMAQAVDVLKQIQRDFPQHAYAKKAEFLIPRLQRNSSPAEAIRELKSIPSTADNYVSAQYELVVLVHQQWSKQPTEVARRELWQSTQRYLQAGRDEETGRKLRALVTAVDAALGGPQADPATAGKLLDQAQPLVAQVPPSLPAAAEYHYQRMQWAKLIGATDKRLVHAGWLVANARGSRFEQPALVAQAVHFDKQLQSAPAAQRGALQQQVAQQFDRLSQLLGDDPQTLRSSKNARVAASRAAQLALDQRRYAEASAKAQRLLIAFPNDRTYLRQAAVASFQRGLWRESLAQWRTLQAGLKSGTADWYEAKVHQLDCLVRIDLEQARPVWKQFRLLHPQQPPAAWRSRVDQLAKTLGSTASGG